jgi:hypothetical protein
MPDVADNLVCNICLETLFDMHCTAYMCTTTNCKCVYCILCVRQWITVTQPRACAFCKNSTTLKLVGPCSVQQTEQCVIQLGVNTEVAEQSLTTFAPIRRAIYHISLVGVLLWCVGITLHMVLHMVVVLQLESCLHSSSLPPGQTSRTQQDIQICIVSSLIYLTSSCVHAIIAMVVIQYRRIIHCDQELILGYGLMSFLICVGRIILFMFDSQLSSGDNTLVICFLLLGSIASSLFDLSFCLWSYAY